MKNFNTAAVAALAFVALCSCALAQDQILTPSAAVGQADISAWMEMSAQFNDRLLATVYWSLGAVVGLVVLVVGVNWFTGQRSYDRDKAAMEAVLKGQLESGLNSIREELLRAETTLRSEQGGAHASFRDELTKLHETRSTELSNAFENILETSLGPVKLEVAQNKDLAKTRSDILQEHIDQTKHMHEYKISQVEAATWMPPRDVPSNALRSYVAALDVNVSYLSGSTASYIMSNIAELLPKAQGMFRADDQAKLIGILNKVGVEHEVIVRKIRLLLAES